jgi:simple sugar transport system ATP-binding protein
VSYALELRAVTKRYGATLANDRISFGVEAGAIHAVLGENGAGKSTLMKIIYGALRADAGEVLWRGMPVSLPNPAAARRLGIGMVYQHFALFETVSVVDNIAVAIDGPFDRAALAQRISALGERYGLPVDPRRLLHDLSVGERQRVEILRCLLQDPKLLILDEPTSVLTPQAALKLFEVLRRLAAEGCSILYISHKLEEIRALCARATILRAGRVSATVDPRQHTAADLARLMVGAPPPLVARPSAVTEQAPRLEVRDLGTEVRDLATESRGLGSAGRGDARGRALAVGSLAVHGGEIVGVAGVSGSGQAELLASLSGATLSRADSVRLDGKPVGDRDAGARRARGLAFVPEERLGCGAVPAMTLADNALMTGHRRALVRHGLVRRGAVRDFASRIIEGFGVRCSGPGARAGSLSGGNLQKFIVGREIALDPRVLIVAQPTWGVDVAAAAFLRQSLIDLSRRGAAVLVVSEELDELFEICDRIAVMFGGRLGEAVPSATTDRDAVGLAMAGVLP